MYVNNTLNENAIDSALKNSSSRASVAVRKGIDKLRTRFRRANPESVNDPLIAALNARLQSILQEVDRVTDLALEQDDVSKQEAHFALARDLQREARAIREQIRLRSGKAALQGRTRQPSE